jgi:short-subunit dehydrogenase
MSKNRILFMSNHKSQKYTLNAVITGASSGMGEQLTYQLGKKGYNVIGLARRETKLATVKASYLALNPNGLFTAITCDVTDTEALKKAHDLILSKCPQIDLLILNAGFGVAELFERLTVEDFRRQFEINVFSVISMLQLFLPNLISSKGHIVLMGSVLSHLSLPGTAPYSMSKYAIKALAEALYIEMKQHRVSVTLISPGFVKTEILKVNNLGQFHENKKITAPDFYMMSAKKASQKIVRAIMQNKRHATISNHGKVSIWLNKLMPVFVRLIGRVFMKKNKSILKAFGRRT